MVVAYVLDGGEGEGESLRELNAANDGEREVAVEEGHESGGAEEEEDGGDGESSGGDLRDGEWRRLGDGDGGDGLHGLDWHRKPKHEARSDVVERGEDECGGEVKIVDQRKCQHYGDVSA